MITLAADPGAMLLKLNTLWPEIVLMIAAFASMILGLSRARLVRRATVVLCGAALGIAALIVIYGERELGLPHVTPFLMYIKLTVCGVGLLLLLTAAELPDESGSEPEPGRAFDPGNVSRGEFFGFFLLSLIGVMLCAGADDLIWLFLALELTSLPTYVMVATSRQKAIAQEAGVKYFFLGAMAAAVFLYGFALLYGATGSTQFDVIQTALAGGNVSDLAIVGMVFVIVGVCFKIAAVPMHAYAADVYQGAATPVTAFLAFVPKAAGFVTLIMLLTLVGWPLSKNAPVLVSLLWALAVATMFFGNTAALLQTNVKRVLAYSSIAHSGYMLVGLVVGPASTDDVRRGLSISDGLAAVLFYLAVYGVMNLGAFAVLGMLKRRGEDAETFEDLNGLSRRQPWLAAVLLICVLALAGMPPLIGFWGKFFLVGSAITGGFYWLAVLVVINSAIAAVYYLRILVASFLIEPRAAAPVEAMPRRWRGLAAGLTALVLILLSLYAWPLLRQSGRATRVFRTGALIVEISSPDQLAQQAPVTSPAD